MDRLPEPLNSFQELVEADLRRAARLIIKVQDELDPQVRIATPKGDYHIALTLPPDDEGRAEILDALGIFMVWRNALGFTFASELVEPDAVYCCGVGKDEAYACLARITRKPRPWTAANFGAVEWLPETSIDPAIFSLLPRKPRPLLPYHVKRIDRWFGREGRFPAVHLPTGEVRGV